MRFLITIQSHKKKNCSVIKILVSMQNGSCFFFFFFWNCHVKTTRLPFELNSKSYFSNRLLFFFSVFLLFVCCYFRARSLTCARGCDRSLGGDRRKGETQIRFLTHHRITPLPINVNNASPLIVCFTHARRIFAEEK